ncbi:hypothetical protein GALL_538090 [mine drainage metagenome]|uniref:Uncharacterized protein n=1 Tax=mine drainage metagenome TaxID=410659 RepID=A0A1J5P200_9ZZZZ
MECVTNFLGYTIKPLTITASAQAERSQADINRLALQLLENALLLERYPTVRVH